MGGSMFKLLQNFTHFPKMSLSRVCLIKADGLMEHGYYKDALAEAKKARDATSANSHEIELAKGKIIQILNALDAKQPVASGK